MPQSSSPGLREEAGPERKGEEEGASEPGQEGGERAGRRAGALASRALGSPRLSGRRRRFSVRLTLSPRPRESQADGRVPRELPFRRRAPQKAVVAERRAPRLRACALSSPT